MAYFLAQFPLQLVVFPGENIPLHIFEPRYRELINDCEQEGIPFGITPTIDGKLEKVGTSMKLVKIKKRYPDGRMDIVVSASHCYTIERFHVTMESKTYGSAEVTDVKFTGISDPTYELHLYSLMQELYSIMRIPTKKIPKRFELHQIVHKIGLTLEEEYRLLCMSNQIDQQIFVIERLEKILPQVREMEEIRKRIEMNGHTRYIIPPK
ncbi:MAG: LON peptidase substrate-binding domain-containing protein [Saprospiraceae bacterium]|nr:LON peptidase substrate-binding domain-containing protein [Saprospiraceae bacterium]